MLRRVEICGAFLGRSILPGGLSENVSRGWLWLRAMSSYLWGPVPEGGNLGWFLSDGLKIMRSRRAVYNHKPILMCEWLMLAAAARPDPRWVTLTDNEIWVRRCTIDGGDFSDFFLCLLITKVELTITFETFWADKRTRHVPINRTVSSH